MGPLQGSLHWPGRGFAATTVEGLSFLIPPYPSSGREKPHCSVRAPHLKTGTDETFRKGKTGNKAEKVLKDLPVIVRSFGQNQKMSAGHSSLTHGCIARLLFHNTFPSFLLCFPHFSSPSAVPRVHLKYHRVSFRCGF